MADINAWPPSNGLTSNIVPRKDAVLQVSSSTTVRAPASLVFDAVLRVADYDKWNTWVPSARIFTQPPSSDPGQDSNDVSRMRIGSTMAFDVVMNANKPGAITRTPLKVVDICTPSSPTAYIAPDVLEDPTFTADLSRVYRVSWTGNGGMYTFGMKLERFHEVIVTAENECVVRTWEIMSGILARATKMMYESTLKDKLGLWCEDLKRYCEKTHAEGTTH